MTIQSRLYLDIAVTCSIVPDCVENVWNEVEIGPVHQKVGEHYLDCHDKMQASKA